MLRFVKSSFLAPLKADSLLLTGLGLILTLFLVGSVGFGNPAGDLNKDFRVDYRDLQILAEQWLEAPSGSAELNGDGKVDIADLALLAQSWHEMDSAVVINEIHYDPDLKTELVEFVELYNAGTSDVNLAGWYFSDGISYQFPAGSMLPVSGYIIVAYDPNHIHAKWSSGRFGIPPELVFSPFEGKLDNSGEKIELCNADGEKIDQVDYQLGFPWPTVGEPYISIH